jgi:uncharacterized repeat protein (TIGR01451 family)
MHLKSGIAAWVPRVTSIVAVLLASATTAAAATANLSVSLSATSDAETYTATISNAGPDTATNVSLTASLPTGIIPINVTPAPGCVFDLPGTMVNCTLGSILNGGSTIVTIAIHPITVGAKTMTVQVSAAETDPAPADNAASASPSINAVGISDVQVTLLDAPDPIRVGQPLYYIASVLNIQDDSAQNVIVEVTVPAGVTLVGAVSSRGACTATGRRFACPLGVLNPSETAYALVVVVPTTSGYIWASALASLTTPDPNPDNNSAAARTWVNP